MCHGRRALQSERKRRFSRARLGSVEDSRRLVAIPHAQAFAGFSQVIDHSVVGQAELSANLLAVEVLVDEAKDFALTVGEPTYTQVW